MTNLNSELPLGANRDAWDGAIVIGGNNGALLGSTNTGHSLKRGAHITGISVNVAYSKYTPHAKTGSRPTLPQSLWLEELAEAILDFFLLSFSFSPASTTSLESLRQLGQYLRCCDKHIKNRENQYINQLMNKTNFILLTSPRLQGWRSVGGSGSRCDRPCHTRRTAAVCLDPAWCHKPCSCMSGRWHLDYPYSPCTRGHWILLKQYNHLKKYR